MEIKKCSECGAPAVSFEPAPADALGSEPTAHTEERGPLGAVGQRLVCQSCVDEHSDDYWFTGRKVRSPSFADWLASKKEGIVVEASEEEDRRPEVKET